MLNIVIQMGESCMCVCVVCVSCVCVCVCVCVSECVCVCVCVVCVRVGRPQYYRGAVMKKDLLSQCTERYRVTDRNNTSNVEM